MTEFRCVILHELPEHPAEWEELCASCGNLQQSAQLDASQAIFGQRPVYFQIFQQNLLAGGLRIYLYHSRRKWLWPFNTYGVQTSEMMVRPGLEFREKIILVMEDLLKEYFHKERVVWSKHTMHYGEADLIPGTDFAARCSVTPYALGFLDLTKPEELLWKSLSENRRRTIKAAEKRGVRVFTRDDPAAFLAILEETYHGQSKSGPDPAYLGKLYQDMHSAGTVELWFAEEQDRITAAIMLTRFGRVAYYNFGGHRRNVAESGSLLHWKCILAAKHAGLHRYYFGQMAIHPDHENTKFTEGITSFKRRFGVTEIPANSITFVHKPLRYRLWKMLKRLSGIK